LRVIWALSVIVSKAMQLARDEKITDPAILSQLCTADLPALRADAMGGQRPGNDGDRPAVQPGVRAHVRFRPQGPAS
jgi:hypothetical protein